MTRPSPAPRLPVYLTWALSCLLISCSAAQHDSSPASVDAEVREFMTGYAADLKEGDREAVAARYTRTGAHLVRGGSYTFRSFEEIRDRYLTSWNPPVGFEWCGLSIEALPPDAAVVVGLFNWQTAETTMQFSYSALLVRENGDLRIRVEDETSIPETATPTACEGTFTPPRRNP